MIFLAFNEYYEHLSATHLFYFVIIYHTRLTFTLSLLSTLKKKIFAELFVGFTVGYNTESSKMVPPEKGFKEYFKKRLFGSHRN
jgi:hypothetical protein